MAEPVDVANARSLALVGNYEDALGLLEKHLMADPHDADALLLKGNTLELFAYAPMRADELSYLNCQELAQAKNCYELILVVEPDHVNAMCDLANLYKAASDEAKCFALLKAAESVLLQDPLTNADALAELRDEIRDAIP
ncbi:MAG: hypothetical protein AB3X41_12435 [Leptothrix ochracea]|uniref:hypothetical protein n=1 Tax=Leptothrix ochracea TaxID=735331 RepID=UPI0034E2DB5B